MQSTPRGGRPQDGEETPGTPRTSTSTDTSERLSPITPPDIYDSDRKHLDRKMNMSVPLPFRDIAAVETPSSNTPLSCIPIKPLVSDTPHFIMIKQLGAGQWSNVYLAELKRSSHSESEHPSDSPSFNRKSGPLTRPAEFTGRPHIVPSSENTSGTYPDPPRVVAVKVPSNKMAQKVILEEARVHSRLMIIPGARRHVIEFFGYDIRTKSLMLEYVPLRLDHVAKSWDLDACKIRRLSFQLVQGLDFLHNANFIHGDVKPSNVLVRHSPLWNTYEPVYCDFSASRFDEPDSLPPESTGTYGYMAPELFRADSIPNRANDVYGLAVTLIHMIIGRGVYNGAPNSFALRAMAMQGRPLAFLLDDMSASRKMERSKMQALIAGASSEKPEHRWTAGEWVVEFTGNGDGGGLL